MVWNTGVGVSDGMHPGNCKVGSRVLHFHSDGSFFIVWQQAFPCNWVSRATVAHIAQHVVTALHFLQKCKQSMAFYSALVEGPFHFVSIKIHCVTRYNAVEMKCSPARCHTHRMVRASWIVGNDSSSKLQVGQTIPHRPSNCRDLSMADLLLFSVQLNSLHFLQ